MHKKHIMRKMKKLNKRTVTEFVGAAVAVVTVVVVGKMGMAKGIVKGTTDTINNLSRSDFGRGLRTGKL